MITIPTQGGPFTFEVERCALIVIDMQNDFCSPQGYGALIGYDGGRWDAFRSEVSGASTSSRSYSPPQFSQLGRRRHQGSPGALARAQPSQPRAPEAGTTTMPDRTDLGKASRT